MYLRHWLTKTCILRQISLVTNHVSHPYKSTDFTQALKILNLVSFCIDVDSHTFLSLENDPLAFCILTLTSVLALPSSATTLHVVQLEKDNVYPKGQADPNKWTSTIQ